MIDGFKEKIKEIERRIQAFLAAQESLPMPNSPIVIEIKHDVCRSSGRWTLT